jgi:hypothetical protein
MRPYNGSEVLGQITFDVIQCDFHRPLVSGKCNREKVEEFILAGVYLEKLPPMNEADVAFVCDLVDDLIDMYGGKK